MPPTCKHCHSKSIEIALDQTHKGYLECSICFKQIKMYHSGNRPVKPDNQVTITSINRNNLGFDHLSIEEGE